MKNQLVVGMAALMMLAACNQNAVDPTTHSSSVRAANTLYGKCKKTLF